MLPVELSYFWQNTAYRVLYLQEMFINSGLTHRLWTLVHIKEIPSCCHIDSFLLLIISTPLNLSYSVVFLFDVAETSRAILSGLLRLLIQQNDFMVQFNFVVSLCSNARYYFFVYRHVCVTLHCLQSKYFKKPVFVSYQCQFSQIFVTHFFRIKTCF